MSRLNDLLRQLRMENPGLADDLQREYDALADRRSFGLNFERHVPEAVELPGRKVRKGDKVRVLPPRGQTRKKENDRLWRVIAFSTQDGVRHADLIALDNDDDETAAPVDDLVVVAEFRDPIYPGLVSTGKVERGDEKPYHAVINAENYHALQTLLFTHRGKVDCIYIDPPYNTGAKDWKYNNDYVEGDDLYRHSKWLAFMERRLLLARELLDPDDSVLIATIDEKEYLRLGLLLEQVFPDGKIQMVSSVINPKGTGRVEGFRRVDEYLFFVRLGDQTVFPVHSPVVASRAVDGPSTEPSTTSIRRLEAEFQTARRRDLQSVRHTRPGQFYPIYVDIETGLIKEVGDPIPHDMPREHAPQIEGCVAVFPVRDDGTEMNWGVTAPTFRSRLANGYARAGSPAPGKPQPYLIQYLKSGPIADIEAGRAIVTGRADDGSVIGEYVEAIGKTAPTQWNLRSHNAEHYGTKLIKTLIPGHSFDFPKSLYAVEDTIRFFVKHKPAAVVLDFFGGSGTTAHAVMRLNRQDGGHRRSIIVSNNEVSLGEQAALLRKGLRPGDPEWEAWGICDHVTKPRVAAAVSGLTPAGEPIRGDYKFTDEFPMADGFAENVEFFTLTYEAPLRVASNREFEKIAALLWLRAGSRGRRIDDISKGWDVADVYGVIADLDQAEPFLKAIAENDDVAMAFIVTDEDRLFESMVAALPDHVEPVRLYESYLRNFEIEAGRGTR